MKITIDDKVCKKHKLDVDEALLVLAVKYSKNVEETFNNLLKAEILVKDDENTYITQRWNDVIDEVLIDSNGGADNEERLIYLAKEMQKLFPAGKMPGTPYYYKCNVREVTLKLKKFFEIHGNYPDAQILDATKRFIASFNGNYKYLPLIKYFITKNKPFMGEDGVNHTVEESQLATFLENKEDSNVTAASDDWLSTVRN